MKTKRLLKNKRLTLALTGLTPNEFIALLPVFSKTWQAKKIE